MSLSGPKSRHGSKPECLNTENTQVILLFTTSSQKAKEGNFLSFRGIEKCKLWICKVGEDGLFCKLCKLGGRMEDILERSKEKGIT